MLMRIPAILFCVGLSLPVTAAGMPCGGDTACVVEGGDYRIEMPGNSDVRGAYVFFHGYKGSAELQMRQHRDLVETAFAHHLAFVAVDGIDGSWSVPNAPSQDRDEFRFVSNVLDDLKTRYGFGAQNTVIGGFSLGASMAYYATCRMGNRVSAMVTFSGVFWDPLPVPSECVSGQPKAIHFHGRADRTFPLNGRAIGKSYHQGGAFRSVAVLREAAKCDITAGRKIVIDGIECDDVPGCQRGNSVLCIHDGGHEARANLLDAGLREVGFPE